ncbi:MAG TPA: ribonuclease HII [Bacteroidota bacterium]|nr:ribonuclease HII [Bacteroidota bacterium]
MSSERAVEVSLRYERKCWRKGFQHVAGVDEAGRGPLAGPVVAAAVIFPRAFFLPEVNDSKQLSGEQREELYGRIMASASAVGVGVVDHVVIDEINILQATYRAMHDATRRLAITPDHLLIDGNRFEPDGIPFTTIIDGDALSLCIAAASIVAKVTRDRIMVGYDAVYPAYGFARHKGYATPEHREAIFKLGYSPIHRRSFVLKTQLELAFDELPTIG